METSVRFLNCVYLSLQPLVLVIVSIVFSNVRGMAWIVVTALKENTTTQNIYILSYHIQYKNKSPHLLFFRMLLLIFLRVFPGIYAFIFDLGLWPGWFSSLWVVGYVWNNCTVILKIIQRWISSRADPFVILQTHTTVYII